MNRAAAHLQRSLGHLRKDYALDYIIPFSKGGPHKRENIQIPPPKPFGETARNFLCA